MIFIILLFLFIIFILHYFHSTQHFINDIFALKISIPYQVVVRSYTSDQRLETYLASVNHEVLRSMKVFSRKRFRFERNDGPLSNNLASYKNTTSFSQSCFIQLFIHVLGKVSYLYLLLELRKMYLCTTVINLLINFDYKTTGMRMEYIY